MRLAPAALALHCTGILLAIHPSNWLPGLPHKPAHQLPRSPNTCLRRCCDSVKPFLSAGCSADPTLLSILPGVGIQPAGLNATLTALKQACGI